MAAGRPAIYVGPAGSEVARTIEAERMGACVANGDVEGLVAAITTRAADVDACQAEGARARAAFDRGYSRAHRTRQFRELLETLP
jgi:colanic acid biosynthesis glycosyl transferase WcaI